MADLSLQCVAMKMGKMNMIINHVNGIPHIRTHKKYQKIGTSLMMRVNGYIKNTLIFIWLFNIAMENHHF